MTGIDVQALLRPVSDELPGGEDFEYEQAFIELAQAAKGKEEQESAGEIIPAEPPDWADVAAKATDLLSETKDLRIAVYLARAATNTDGFQSVGDGLELIAGMLEQYWDVLYPPLDEEDNDDPTLRLNSLLPLNDPTGFIRDIAASPIVTARLAGKFSIRDVRLAAGDVNPREGEERPDGALIEAAFEESEIDDLQQLADRVTKAQEAASMINNLLVSKVGENAPSFDLLEQELRFVAGTIGAHLKTRAPSDNGESSDMVDTAGVLPISGEVRSRADAIRCLEQISQYFRIHEPSSPVPFLLDRAKGLISKDYLEIISDLTPGSVTEATNILMGDQNG